MGSGPGHAPSQTAHTLPRRNRSCPTHQAASPLKLLPAPAPVRAAGTRPGRAPLLRLRAASRQVWPRGRFSSGWTGGPTESNNFGWKGPLEGIIQFSALRGAVSNAPSGSSRRLFGFWAPARMEFPPSPCTARCSSQPHLLGNTFPGTQGGFPSAQAAPVTSRLFAVHLCCCLLHNHPAGSCRHQSDPLL